MKRIFGKKGTEKPIEIFVALFIILAVAMVMLKVFNTQITQQQDTLSDEEQKRQLEYLQTDAKQECSSLCALAQSNQCSPSDKAEYCMKRINEYWSKSPDGTILQQIGTTNYCEDTLYCPQITKCECGGRELTIENCFKLVCDRLLNEHGWLPAQAETYLTNTVYHPGACYATASGQDQILHWYFSKAPMINCSVP